MTDFADAMAADIHEVLLNSLEFAQEVSYTPDGGAPKSINAIFHPGGREPEMIVAAGEATHDFREGRLFISADATEGIAEPARGDQVTIGSLAYGVDAVEQVFKVAGAAWATLRITAQAREKLSQPGQRMEAP